MYYDIDPIWLIKEVLQLCMEAVVGTVSRRGLSIGTLCRKQPHKNKLLLYISLYFSLNDCSKQLYIKNKMEHLAIKVGVAYVYQGI